METKYQTLLNILDCLRREAPPEFKRYHALESETDKVNAARARTFVHLYLKVIFGLLDFKEREYFITDGTNDGGIDAYYIDNESRKVIFIQSKFRTNGGNFSAKDITIAELLKMDVEKITEGEINDEEGNEYNGKIKQLQRDIHAIPDIARYKYEIVLLANLKDVKPIQLKKLLEFPVEVFDFNRTYNELVFPVVSGTYYNESELCIRLNLTNTSSANVRASYSVETEFKKCDISMVFVPTIEIAKILHKYKNSILKYNPRSYLELANNDVNRDIALSITGRTTNEFALFNNGITILSNGTSFNEKVGVKDEAQVIVTSPQIIDRELFLRICMACDFRTSKARSSGLKQLFSEDNFSKTLSDVTRANEYFYGFRSWQRLNTIERKFDKDKNNIYGTVNYGQGLRYGKFAIVAACNHLSDSKYLNNLESDIDYVLEKWIEFESYAASQPLNSGYFWEYTDPETKEKFQERNYNGYYKGRTVDRDLRAFFCTPKF